MALHVVRHAKVSPMIQQTKPTLEKMSIKTEFCFCISICLCPNMGRRPKRYATTRYIAQRHWRPKWHVAQLYLNTVKVEKYVLFKVDT